METDALHTHKQFEQFRRQLMLFYYALMASMVTMYVVVVMVLAPQSPKMLVENQTVFLIAVPLINLVIVATGSYLFRLRIKAAAAAEGIAQKIAEYRIGYIVRGALLESLAILNVFAYFTMRDMKFEILFILLLLLYVISAYPNPDKLKREMGM